MSSRCCQYYALLLGIVVALFSLASCEADFTNVQLTASQTNLPLTTISITLTATLTPTIADPNSLPTTITKESITVAKLTLTPSPAPPQITAPITGPLPDLLINTSTAEDYVECAPPGTSRVWLTKYPYSTAGLLVADSGKNYFAPTWSPDGEWIAYIESETKYLYENGKSSGAGQESIMIMRSDRSERRQVSGALPSVSQMDLYNMCIKSKFIQPSLNWSPDGRYIVFSHVQTGPVRWDYYLVDVKENQTDTIPDIKGNSPAIWSADSSRLLMFGKGKLIIIRMGETGELNFDSVSVPTQEGNPESAAWLVNQDSLVVTLHRYTLYPELNLRTVWRVDIVNGSWTKLLDLNEIGDENGVGGSLIFGKSWAASIGIKSDFPIYFIDLRTWKIMGSTPQKSNKYDFTYPSKWLQDSLGDDLISFNSFYEMSGEIWLVKPQVGILDAQPLINGSLLEIPLNHHFLDFDWKPDNLK